MSGRAVRTLVLLFLLFGGTATSAHGARLYWTTDDAIMRSDLDGSNVRVFRQERAGGIAVAAGKVYWAPDFQIKCADLDGSNVQNVISNIGIALFLAIDLAGQKVYWSEPSSRKVRRADLDGSNIEDLVVDPDYFPNGIALDIANGKMYFGTFDGTYVVRANLDGSNVEELLSDSDLPAGIDVDVANDKLYYASVDNGSVIRTNLDGSNPSHVFGFPDFAGFDVKLDLATGKVYASSWFFNKGIWRADLDGSNVENVIPDTNNTFGLGFRIALELPEIPEEPDPVPATSWPASLLVALLLLAGTTTAALYRRRTERVTTD